MRTTHTLASTVAVMGVIRRRWKLLLGLGALLGVMAYFAVPYVYIHFINDPKPALTFENRDKELAKAGAAEPVSSTDGEWFVTQPSTAGYRVKETLNGQSTSGVGRTNTVDGSFTLAGASIKSAEFNVDVSTLTSDQARRDKQVKGRLLATDEFPVATFTLNEPIALGTLPADGVTIAAKASGTLSLRGKDKPVTLDLQARRSGDKIEVLGNAALNFADFGIPDPSVKPFVSTEQSGVLEVSLTLSRAPGNL